MMYTYSLDGVFIADYRYDWRAYFRPSFAAYIPSTARACTETTLQVPPDSNMRSVSCTGLIKQTVRLIPR